MKSWKIIEKSSTQLALKRYKQLFWDYGGTRVAEFFKMALIKKYKQKWMSNKMMCFWVKK